MLCNFSSSNIIITESWTYWKHNPISFRGWVVSSVVKVELWMYSDTLLFVNMYLK